MNSKILQGAIESISKNKITGWAYLNNNEHAVLEVFLGTIFLGRCIANSFRSDLPHLINGFVGFSFDLTPSATDQSLPYIYSNLNISCTQLEDQNNKLKFHTPLIDNYSKILGDEKNEIKIQIHSTNEEFEIEYIPEEESTLHLPISVSLNNENIISKILHRKDNQYSFKLKIKKAPILGELQKIETDGVLQFKAGKGSASLSINLGNNNFKSIPEISDKSYSFKSHSFVTTHGKRSIQEQADITAEARELVSILEDYAPTFINGGSLIGALRNGKLVPHDDDIDLAIYIGDQPSTIAAAIAFENLVAKIEENISVRIKRIRDGLQKSAQ